MIFRKDRTVAMETPCDPLAAPATSLVKRRRLSRKTPVAKVPEFADSASASATAACVQLHRASKEPRGSMKRGKFVLTKRHDQYVVVREALDSELRAKVLGFLKTRKLSAAKMKNEGAGGSDDERKERYDDRDCWTHWFNAQNECPDLHRRLVDIIREVANVEWPLLNVKPLTGELCCDFEETQYTVYGPGQHFSAWHQDAYADGHDVEDARQFSLVVMLSKRKDYTAGDFEMRLPSPNKGKRMRRKLTDLDAGDVIVFPAKVLEHRVTPVGTGTRRTLVFWPTDLNSCIYGNPSLEKKKGKKRKAVPTK